jgi:uncharacterized membrane protein AbrB (regulator of aidB expression)
MPKQVQYETPSQSVWLKPWVAILALAFATIGAILGFAGHLEHLLAALLYVPLLLCVLMHIFMHGHHGSRHRHDAR